MSLKEGDWFTFTEGPYAGLLAIVTGTTILMQSPNRTIQYDLIGDGRDQSLKHNAVYELVSYDTEMYMISARKLSKANIED